MRASHGSEKPGGRSSRLSARERACEGLRPSTVWPQHPGASRRQPGASPSPKRPGHAKAIASLCELQMQLTHRISLSLRCDCEIFKSPRPPPDTYLNTLLSGEQRAGPRLPSCPEARVASTPTPHYSNTSFQGDCTVPMEPEAGCLLTVKRSAKFRGFPQPCAARSAASALPPAVVTSSSERGPRSPAPWQVPSAPGARGAPCPLQAAPLPASAPSLHRAVLGHTSSPRPLSFAGDRRPPWHQGPAMARMYSHSAFTLLYSSRVHLCGTGVPFT